MSFSICDKAILKQSQKKPNEKRRERKEVADL